MSRTQPPRRRTRTRTRKLSLHHSWRPRLEPLEDRRLLSGNDYFSQAQNGDPPNGDLEWINGILNNTHTTFFEGMSTLQRVYIENISGDLDPGTSGNQHALRLEHKAEAGGKHAYDFLTSWEQALAANAVIAPGAYPDPITDALASKPGSSAPSTFEANSLAVHAGANIVDVPIPDMTNPSIGGNVQGKINAYEGFFGNRTVRIYGNASITNASMAFDGYNPQDEAQYTLRWTSNSSFVDIEFGAHIAQGQDFLLTGVGYGAGLGAGSISGGNYHVQLITFDGAATGSQDNQLQAGAVQAPPDFTIDKDGPDLSKATDQAVFTFTLTHTGEAGSANLVLVSIVDDQIGDLEPYVPAALKTLSPGESGSFDVTFTIPADAADPFVNTVEVVYGIGGSSLLEFTRTDTHSTNLFQPAISVEKNAIDPPDPLLAGDTVIYEIKITNVSSGDSPVLVPDTIDDTLLGPLPVADFLESISNDNVMQVGEVWTGTFDYVVQQSDVVGEGLTNTVTVHFHPQGFPNDITGDDSVTLEPQPLPNFSIEKSGDALSKVGDNITYVFTLRHTGPAGSPDIDLVTLVDTVLGNLADDLALQAPQLQTLSVGESGSFQVVYTVQPGDPDPLVNTVTAVYGISGRPEIDFSHADTHSTNLFQPAIFVDKNVVAAPAVLLAGDTVTYGITITNQSSSDSPVLVPNSIDDTLLGPLPVADFLESISNDNVMQFGEVWTGTFDYVVQESDVGGLTNTVTVHFHPEGFPNDISDDASVIIDVLPPPDFRIDKRGDDLSKVGDDITYVFTLFHGGPAGSPDLELVSLGDTVLGDLTIIVPPELHTLSPGESGSFQVIYTVQPGDPDPLVNTVTAVYGISGRPEIEFSRSDTHSTNLFQPAINVEKNALDPPEPLFVGDTVTYEVKITNISSIDSPVLVPAVPPAGVGIFDTLMGPLPVDDFDESISDDNVMQPGEVWTGAFDYVVQPSDFPSVTNTVTVHFHPQGFPNDIADDDSVTLQVELPPVDEGRMTGGGSIFLPAGATPDDEGLRVTHGFQLHCFHDDADGDGLTDANNRLEINWGKPNNHFHLFGLTSVVCLDTGIVQAPPDAPIDTLDGTGVGRFSGRLPDGTRLNNVAATIVFTLTDGGPEKGEPGLDDTAAYLISADTNGNGVPDTVVLNTLGPQLLQSKGHSNGNHQSHEEIPPLQSSQPTVAAILRDIETTFNRLDNPNLTQNMVDSLTRTVLAQFEQLEAALADSASSSTAVASPAAATLVTAFVMPSSSTSVTTTAAADPVISFAPAAQGGQADLHSVSHQVLDLVFGDLDTHERSSLKGDELGDALHDLLHGLAG